MRIALLATGDELIVGDTLNTNTQNIAQLLRSESLNPGLHLVCGDDETEILHCMRFLCEQHQTLIAIGGLGPTSDDKTRYALSKLIDHPLIEFPNAIQHIESRLASVQLSMNQENRQQALFPAHAQLLPNPNGTAVGCFVTWASHDVFLLPGPPRECLPMFEHHVIPFLKEKHARSHLTTRKWLLFGVAESHIAAKLDELLKDIDCQTGYRLDMPYLECKVHCRPDQLKTIEALVNPIVAPYIITQNHTKASILLAEYIAAHPMPVTIIDKITGGRLQSHLQRPDNCQWLSFYQKNDPQSIVFEISGLEHYWQQQADNAQTNVSISCTSGEHILHQQTHRMPFHYRNHALVLSFAMEWLCAKLLEILSSIRLKE